jgi:hypothetical protein
VICFSADVIVTYNLTDFPAATLAGFDLEAQHPDDFLVGLLDLAPGVVDLLRTSVLPRTKVSSDPAATSP